MLVATVVGPPAIDFGFGPRTSDYTRRAHCSYSHGRSYYSQRKDFYTLLRWVCCAAFAYSTLVAIQMKRIAWTWIFGILTVLFNPFVIVHLQRATWQIIDWTAIGIIVIGAIVFWRDKGTFNGEGQMKRYGH